MKYTRKNVKHQRFNVGLKIGCTYMAKIATTSSDSEYKICTFFSEKNIYAITNCLTK